MKKCKYDERTRIEILFENIDDILEEKNYTQKKLTNNLEGLTETSFSKCKFDKQTLTFLQFYEISQVLDVNPNDLIFSKKERKKYEYIIPNEVFKNEGDANYVNELNKKGTPALVPMTLLCPLRIIKRPYNFLTLCFSSILIITCILILITDFLVAFEYNYYISIIGFLLLILCLLYIVKKFNYEFLERREYIIPLLDDIYYRIYDTKTIRYFTLILLKISSIFLVVCSLIFLFILQVNFDDSFQILRYTLFIPNIISMLIQLFSILNTKKEINMIKKDGDFLQYSLYTADVISPLFLIAITLSYHHIYSHIYILMITYTIILILSFISHKILSTQLSKFALSYESSDGTVTTIE